MRRRRAIVKPMFFGSSPQWFHSHFTCIVVTLWHHSRCCAMNWIVGLHNYVLSHSLLCNHHSPYTLAMTSFNKFLLSLHFNDSPFYQSLKFNDPSNLTNHHCPYISMIHHPAWHRNKMFSKIFRLWQIVAISRLWLLVFLGVITIRPKAIGQL